MARKEETRRILNNLRAESRMAAFFISIISRMASIGYSNQEIQLKMTNKDIANFLGVKGETISRAKKSLVKTGAILWDKKNFKILNLEILNKIISPKTSPNLMFGF
jgi:CRP/FNR family transcriptional regulator